MAATKSKKFIGQQFLSPLSIKSNDPLEKIPNSTLIYISFSLGILGVILVFLSQNRLPPEVPLFYGLPESDDQLASSIGLIIPSASSLMIIVVNTVLAFLVRNRFLQKTLVLTSLAMGILTLITTIKITFLVGRF